MGERGWKVRKWNESQGRMKAMESEEKRKRIQKQKQQQKKQGIKNSDG